MLRTHRREQARKSKDWALADKLRKEIEATGWQIKDSQNGPQLTKN